MNSCCRDTIESLLTAAQVAEALGIGRRHVWKLARVHGIGVDVGGTRMFTPVDVEALRRR